MQGSQKNTKSGILCKMGQQAVKANTAQNMEFVTPNSPAVLLQRPVESGSYPSHEADSQQCRYQGRAGMLGCSGLSRTLTMRAFVSHFNTGSLGLLTETV